MNYRTTTRRRARRAARECHALHSILSAVRLSAEQLESRLLLSSSSPAAVPAAASGPVPSVALAPNVYSGGGTSYLFALTYADASAIDTSSLGNGNVRVRGNNGFNQPAALVSVAASAGATNVTATYSLPAPGGAWDPSDSASYSLVLQPSQVRDAGGAYAPAGTVGSFQAAIAGTPLQPYLMPASDTGVSSHDQITSLDNSTSARTLRFDIGDTLPGVLVTVRADGKVIASTVATGTDTLVTTDGSTALSAGAHNIIARQLGLDGRETADSAALQVTILPAAGAAPAAPVLEAASDTGASNSDDITAVNTPTFDLTAGPYFRAYRNGQLVSGPASSGTTFTSAALPDGTYAFTVSAVDAAGNESPQSAATAVTIDTAVPAAAATLPNVSQAGGTAYTFTVAYTDNEAVDAYSLGNANVVVTGPGSFSQAATLVSLTPAGNGTPRTATYQFTPPGGSWSSAADGTYTVSLAASQVRDLAGNFVPAEALGTFTVAADSLGAPALAAATDSGLSSSDGITNFNNASPDKALQFTVTNAVPGAVVGIYADGTLIGSAAAPAAPAGSPAGTLVTATVTTDSTTALADGVHTMTARQTPPGGATSGDSAASTVTILTAAPAAPGAPVLESSSDTGISSTDGLTNQATPTFDVTAPGPGILHLQGAATDGSVSLTVPAAGTYHITFAPPTGFLPAVTSPTTTYGSITVGDFNGDGLPDLFTPDTLLSNGDGTFRVLSASSSAPSAIRHAVADFNGDGKLDLAATGSNQTQVFLGNGDGTFRPGQLFNGASGAASADFNGDGKADLVVADATGLSVYLGNGDGTFQGALTKVPLSSVYKIQVGDFNKDGKADLVAGGAILLGNGDGTFGKPNYFAGVSADYVIDEAVSDLDGDGNPDVLLLSGVIGPMTALIEWGKGDGTFQPAPTAVTLPAKSYQVAVGDFNRDGLPDFAATSDTTPGAINVVYGSGGRTFQPAQPLSLGTDYTDGLVAADFNGDGRLDLASAQALPVSPVVPSTVSVLLGTGGALTDGTHPISAWFEDAAGNPSPASPGTNVTVDHTPPTATVNAPPVTAGAASYSFSVTYADARGIDASSLASANVTVTGPNGFSALASLVSVDALGNGSPRTATYRITAPGGGWSQANSGAYSIVLAPNQLKDLAGNSLAGGTLGTFSVAVAAAPARPVLLPATDSGLFSTDGMTNFNNSAPWRALQFTVGNTLPGATVTLYADGTPIGSAVATGTSTTITTDGKTTLADGAHAVTARQQAPGAAQTADSLSLSTIIDTVAPAAPPAPVLSAASDTGASSSDGITRITTPTLGLNAGPYERVYLGGTLLSGSYATGSSFTTAKLPDGVYQFTVTSVDAAGNESARSAPVTVQIDTQAPTAVAALPGPNLVGTAPYTFTVTYADNVALDGSSLATGNVVVTGPNSFSQPATLVSVDNPGNGTPRTATYQVTPPAGGWTAAIDGTYTASLAASQVRDTAGNYIAAQPLGTFTLTADTLGAPALLAATDSGASSSDGVTNFNNASPAKALQFSVPNTRPGDLIGIYADGKLIGSVTASGAAGSATTVTTDGATVLADGVHQITARRMPPGGTPSADSPALAITIDATPPPAPTLTLDPASDSGKSNNDGATNVTTPTFDVTSSEPGVIHLQGLGADGSVTATAAAGGTTLLPFAPAAGFTIGSSFPVVPQVVYAHDVNGDGKIDLIASEGAIPSTGIGVFLGNGDGTFQPQKYTPATRIGSVFADVNGDGKIDLITNTQDGTSGVWALLGNGDGTFQPQQFMQLPNAPAVLGLGDFNGDGIPDTAVQTGDTTTQVYLGNADGTFHAGAKVTYPSLGSGGSLPFPTVADLNGDGKLDLIYVHRNVSQQSGNYLYLLLGRGDGTFGSFASVAVPGVIYGASAYANSNGKTMVAVLAGPPSSAPSSPTPVPTLTTYISNGDGTFSPSPGTVPLPAGYFAGVLASDFNGDGRVDYAMTSFGGSDGAFDILDATGGPLPDGPHDFQAFVQDLAGNVSATSTTATIKIDTVGPKAALAAPDLTTGGSATYNFTVTYTDSTAVDVSTLDSNDLVVTGPNGFSGAASLVSVDNPADGSPRVATYSVTAPDAAWSAADNGTYTVALRASQVADTVGNSAPAATLGAFLVNVPPSGEAGAPGAQAVPAAQVSSPAPAPSTAPAPQATPTAQATPAAQSPQSLLTVGSGALLKDLDPRTVGSTVWQAKAVNGIEYLVTADAANTWTVWASDGTAGGTAALVSFPRTGPGASPLPAPLASLGRIEFFTAANQLWRTDGTPDGTAVVAPVKVAGNAVAVNNDLYFAASDASNTGTELWRTDGTAAGTQIVKDINPGAGSSIQSDITAVFGTLYFGATDGTAGSQLWKSDGTAAGTVMVKNLGAGATITPEPDAGGTFFFTTPDAANGFNLWKSDGTAAGTVALKDVTASAGATGKLNGYAFTGTPDRLFFATSDGGLWTSDGTAAGTVELSATANVQSIATFGGATVYFSTGQGELWSSDGTAGGTGKITAVPNLGPLTPLNGELYFSGSDAAHGQEPWVSDGSAAGTHLLADVNPGPAGSSPDHFTAAAGGPLYFTADDGLHGTEPWVSDGSAAGTSLVKDLNPAPLSSSPNSFTAFDHNAFFLAQGPGGPGLYKSDGTSEGTALVAAGATNIATTLNGKLYFVAGATLYSTAGNPGDAQAVATVGQGATYQATVNGLLFFTVPAGNGASQLWRSDGTAAGTVQLPSPAGAAFYYFTPADNYLFYYTAAGFGPGSAWRTDGTAAGTFQLASNVGSNVGILLASAAASGHRVLFYSTYYGGPYTTDGTVAGTVPLTDPAGKSIGLPNSNPTSLIVGASGTIYFLGSDTANTFQDALYKTDGTAAGTVKLSGLPAQGSQEYPSGLVNAGGMIYFWNEYQNQYDLWRSDGTPAGTFLLAAHVIGGGTFLAPFGTSVYFAADNNGSPGVWSSNGTVAGTGPLPAGSATPPEVNGLTVDGTLFFANTDPVHGTELWSEAASVAPTVPQTPTGLTATADGAVVNLSWAEPPGNTETSVRLQRSTDPNFTSIDETLVLSPGTTQYADSVANGGASTYYYRIAAANSAGSSPFSQPVSVQIPFTLSTKVGDGSAQRSVVKTVTLSFSVPVNLAAGAVTLSRLNTGGSGANDGSAPTDLSAALTVSNPSGDGMTWVVSFGANNAAADTSGSLSDGAYTLTVHAAAVTSTGGRPFAGGDQAITFHRLFGDTDGNGTVNALDYARFKQAFGSASGAAGYNPALDDDGNGSINALDYAQFRKRFGSTFSY